ncbi:hypothetical protein HK100_012282 [Physocladia obscura]|uniref:C3H1-type domain-containing protein n=1 Tax=Physocladia obscura TaxID=109957 RepID=A0AAD5T1G8_9FUNG|nr:hypothetical protein HK100_012282 [Physocladia obscura]
MDNPCHDLSPPYSVKEAVANTKETVVEFMRKNERLQMRLQKNIEDDARQMQCDIEATREYVASQLAELETRVSAPIDVVRVLAADVFGRNDARNGVFFSGGEVTASIKIVNSGGNGLMEIYPECFATTSAGEIDTVCAAIHDAIIRRSGNAVRTAATEMLRMHARALSLPSRFSGVDTAEQPPVSTPLLSDRDSLAQIIKAITNCLTTILAVVPAPAAFGIDSDLLRLLNALHSIKTIGNWASHTHNELTYYKQIELIAAFGTITEMMPEFFKLRSSYIKIKQNEAEFAAIQQEDDATNVNNETSFSASSSTLSPSTASSSPTKEFHVAPGAIMLVPPGLSIMPPSTVAFPFATNVWSTVTTQKTSALAFIKPASVVAVTKPITLTAKPKLKYYYPANADIPTGDGRMALTYQAMQEHMKKLDKARLCKYGSKNKCLKPECKESHSYQEVFTYNPLYKVIKCIQTDHFNHEEVYEPSDCVCAHVDLELSLEWMKKGRSYNSKFYLCDDRKSCSDVTCLRSHTVEEISWYSPFFRTKKCEFGSDCTKGQNCLGLHNGKSKPEFRGVEAKVLFLERTHKELARRLTAVDLRFR